ncbi:PREDICTED: leucine-rich repeat-containing protein 15-like [Branchiostoma belcheri]|uniref:Leucine-rich repeat-containing protein 15-like n=1 Tax=Branchiostoma belcheri TaxID=7741 RepID=A0A6P4Z6F4_BRABE|nr:PREDICTED: leucine-rich repeat-containing protein 15-like [Branchiostoma belcheri]
MSSKGRRMLVLLLIIVMRKTGPTAACSSSCSSKCDCSNSGLSSVPQDLPTTITKLDLEGNAITALSQSDFSRYRSLTTLELQANQISMIHNKTFHNLTSLTHLNLGDNHLTNLTTDMFAGLSNLWYLTLHNNQLTSLPAGIFAGLGNLREVWLQHNQLTNLPTDIFAGLANLKDLQLTSNKLTNLPTDIFAGLGILRLLWLSDNKLTSLPNDIFAGLANLKDLRLSSNKLTSLPDDIFVGLGNLEKLYLNGNDIHNIEAGTFSDTTQLRDLNLGYNKIGTITANTLENLLQLQILSLYHTNINTFPVEALSNLNISVLSELSLNNNQLETLPPMAYDILASISNVRIDNNPWQCDCMMAPFRQRMNGSKPFENQIRCAGPANLIGQYLQDVNPEDLICEDMTPVYSTSSTKHIVDSTLTLSLSSFISSSPFHQSVKSTTKAPTLSPTQSNTPTADSNHGWSTVSSSPPFDPLAKSTSKALTKSNTPTADSNPGPSTVSSDSPFGFQSTMTESNPGPTGGGIVLSVPLLAALGVIFGLLLICTSTFTILYLFKRRQRDLSNTNPTGTSSRHDQIRQHGFTTNAGINSQSETPHPDTEDSQHIYNLPTDEDPDTVEYNTIGEVNQSESPHRGAGNRQSLDSFNDGYEVPSPSLCSGEGPQSHKYVNSCVTAAAKDAEAGPQVVIYENEDESVDNQSQTAAAPGADSPNHYEPLRDPSSQQQHTYTSLLPNGN